jgi:hypothetical protein
MGEHRNDDLAVDVVDHHQREQDREHHPRIPARRGPVGCEVVGNGVQGHVSIVGETRSRPLTGRDGNLLIGDIRLATGAVGQALRELAGTADFAVDRT